MTTVGTTAVAVAPTPAVALLGVAVGAVAVLAARRRRAVEDRSSSAALHRVAEAATDGSPVDVVLDLVLAAVREELHLRAARFELTHATSDLPELRPTGAVDTLEHDRAAAPAP
jgi:hypothetical protein